MQYPVVTSAFERVLLATAFSNAAMILSWGLIAAVGASHAAFYLLPMLGILHYLLVLPMATSFHSMGIRGFPGSEIVMDMLQSRLCLNLREDNSFGLE